MTKIADFNDADRWVVETALKELIVELALDRIFAFARGTRFEGGLALGPNTQKD